MIFRNVSFQEWNDPSGQSFEALLVLWIVDLSCLEYILMNGTILSCCVDWIVDIWAVCLLASPAETRGWSAPLVDWPKGHGSQPWGCKGGNLHRRSVGTSPRAGHWPPVTSMLVCHAAPSPEESSPSPSVGVRASLVFWSLDDDLKLR